MKAITCLLFALMLAACGRENAQTTVPSVTAREASPELAATSSDKILAWLECEECIDGELKAVVGLGQDAVPALAETLRNGTSSERRASYERQLAKSYDDLRNYVQRDPNCKGAREHERNHCRLSVRQDEYITRYRDNLDALYKVRSARALAEIGGGEAFKHLQEAVNKREPRADVRDAIATSLEELRKKQGPQGIPVRG